MPRTGSLRRGFTIIELLVVIAILVTLMGLMLPLIAMLRNSEKAASTRATVTELMVAMQAYADEDPRHFYPTPRPDDRLDFVEPSTTATLTLLTKAGYGIPMKDIGHDPGSPTYRMLLDGWRRPVLYRLDGPFINAGIIDSSRMDGIADRPAGAVVDDWNPKGVEPFPYVWSLGKPTGGDATDALPASAARWIYQKGLK